MSEYPTYHVRDDQGSPSCSFQNMGNGFKLATSVAASRCERYGARVEVIRERDGQTRIVGACSRVASAGNLTGFVVVWVWEDGTSHRAAKPDPMQGEPGLFD